MNNSYGILELNECADRVTAYLYVDGSSLMHFGSCLDSIKALNYKNECLETSIVSNNGRLWLEVRWILEEKELDSELKESMENPSFIKNSHYNSSKPHCSDKKIVLKLPNRLQVQDVLSVSYYHENIISMISNKDEINILENNPILFSRVILNLKSKLSLIAISALVTDIEYEQISEFPVIEKNESVCLDFETKLLNHFSNKNPDTQENFIYQLNLSCKGCGYLISNRFENWITAPLPSEMLVHGSEMFTCDNCCPLLASNTETHYCRNFGARPNWICLGQYHISVHTSNLQLNRLLIRDELNPQQTLESFFIKDINNIYFSNQTDFHSVFCHNCGINLGWKNGQDNHLNLWKSKVLVNILSNQNTTLTLFGNYHSTSLTIHYIEKYLKQFSKLYITELNKTQDLKDQEDNDNNKNKKSIISLYIIKKNIIKLKTQLFIGCSNEEIESQTNLSKKRSIIYSSIKVSFDLNCNSNIKTNQHTIYLKKEDFYDLTKTIQENTLFNKNSFFNIPILSNDLV